MSTIEPLNDAPVGRHERGILLTPRNLMIIALAAIGAEAGIPAVLPAVEAGSPPSLMALIALMAALDRVVGY